MRCSGRGARRSLPLTFVLFLGAAAWSCENASPDPAPILLFTGIGASASDVAAVERVLDGADLDYATASSAQLNHMSAAQLMGYRLIIVPGGDFIGMSGSFTHGTTAKLHDAVQHGVNYLGICAGAFLAGDGGRYYDSFNLASGARFEFYGAERRGIRKAAVMVTRAGADPIEQYWEDGPELSGWGSVVGRYPDGTPAVVQGSSGRGWVILVGVHPEAPETWRRGLRFTTPASVANEYAGTLTRAALSRAMLPHY